MQLVFWNDTGPASEDGETCGRFLPTPSVCGNYNRKGSSKTSDDGLATVIKRGAWTLSAAASPARTSATQDAATESKDHAADCFSRPFAWFEWLMGFPLGWTDCVDSETLSFRKSPSGSDGK